MTSPETDSKKASKNMKMVPLRLVLMPIAILILSIIAFVIMAAMAPKPEKQTVDVFVPTVDWLTVKPETVQFHIKSQATVTPRTQTMLISEVTGHVKFVAEKFVVGGYFKQGELMLSIDPLDYEVALLQAQARLEAAEARWVEEKAKAQQAEQEWRMTGKPMKDAPVLALRKPILQQAAADIKAAKADVTGAKVKLARTKVTAPYDAIIKEKMVDVGQYVTLGSSLASSFAVDYAEVRLPVKANELAFVNLPGLDESPLAEKGGQVFLKSSSVHDDYIWQSYISRSEGIIDSKTRIQYLIAVVDDPYNLQHKKDRPQLPIGSFVEADIESLSLENIYRIPRTAMRRAQHLYLINKEQKLQIQKVEVLHSDRDYFYVEKGLQGAVQLILTNLQTPIEGMALQFNDAPSDNRHDSSASVGSEHE